MQEIWTSDLNLGEQAVKSVLTTVYQKCHVRNRLQLAPFVVKHELLSGTMRDEKESLWTGT